MNRLLLAVVKGSVAWAAAALATNVIAGQCHLPGWHHSNGSVGPLQQQQQAAAAAAVAPPQQQRKHHVQKSQDGFVQQQKAAGSSSSR
jgi:hypothetical protein